MKRDDVPVLLVTPADAAQMLGVSRGRTIQVLIDTGQLKSVQINGRTRIPMAEVERLAHQGFDVRQS
jgi:excisionase family DNA binding protein